MTRINAVCLALVLVVILGCMGGGNSGNKPKGISVEEYVADRPTGKYNDKVATVTGKHWSLNAGQSNEKYYAFTCGGLQVNQLRDSAEGNELFELLKDGGFHELTVDLSARDHEGNLFTDNAFTTKARVVKIY